MPNWCSNIVTFGHAEPKQIARLLKAAEEGEVLQEFVPCPAELLDDELTTYFKDDAKQAEVDAKKTAVLAKHGYQSWYDWCTAYWGTKWDLSDITATQPAEDTVQLTFNTAWAPPIEAYAAMEEQGWHIYAMYYEPGMVFAGVYSDGSDDCYQNWGDSRDARTTLPSELDEMFGISETQAEWERETEDEVTTWYKDGVDDTGLKPHNPPKEI